MQNNTTVSVRREALFSHKNTVGVGLTVLSDANGNGSVSGGSNPTLERGRCLTVSTETPTFLRRPVIT